MNQDPVRVSKVHWTTVFPFLRLFRSGVLGCGLSPFILAYACLAIAWGGSSVISYGLSGETANAAIDFSVGSQPGMSGSLRIQQTGGWQVSSMLPPPVSGLRWAVSRTYFHHEPLAFLQSGRSQTLPWFLAPAIMLWNALVIGFFGTALARSVATEFCQQSRTGVLASIRYAWRHWWSTLLATGLVFGFLTGLCLILKLVELVTRVGAIGEWAASLVWGPLFLLAVALTLVFLIGGLAWLLSLAATGTDGCTGAEGLSRCISYLLSHPVWALSGLVVVTALSVVTRQVANLVVLAAMNALPGQLSATDSDIIRRFWVGVVQWVPHAMHLSVFLAGIAVLYVLLRHKEDGIAIEEIDGAA